MKPDLALAYCRMIAQTLGLDQDGLDTLVANTGIDAHTLQTSDGFIDWPCGSAHRPARFRESCRRAG